MIIIVDGCDLSGKTTMIEKLSKHYNNGLIIKNSYRPKLQTDSPKIIEQYVKMLKLCLQWDTENPDQLIILDRFFPSQAVYSFLRKVDELKSPELLLIEKTCINHNIGFIYLDTPLEELKARYKSRGDDFINFDQLNTIHDRYTIFADNTKLKTLRLNTMDTNWLRKADIFLTHLKTHIKTGR